VANLFPPFGETSEGMIHYFGGFVQSDEGVYIRLPQEEIERMEERDPDLFSDI